jgi:hypothetical protein
VKRWDWIPPALLALAALAAAWVALGAATRAWAGRWRALRARPQWLQLALLLAALWLGLRFARLGWRALVAYGLVVGGLALWGEVAIRGDAARLRR